MTAFATLLGAIVNVLSTPTPVATLIDRARLRPIPDGPITAVVVRLQASNAERFAILNGPVDWDTEIDLDCYARSSDSGDVAVDALLGAVYDRLSADPTLGDLATDLRVDSIEYDFAAGAENLACATLKLRVLHRTNHLTLE